MYSERQRFSEAASGASPDRNFPERAEDESAESAGLRKQLCEAHGWTSVSKFNKEGVAIVDDGTEYFLIDKQGYRVENPFGPSSYDWIDAAGPDLTWASRDGRCYLIAPSGRAINKNIIQSYEPFSGEWARVKLEDATYTFINREGSPISQQRFEQLGPLVDGEARAKLKSDGKWYRIDIKGNLISTAKRDEGEQSGEEWG